MGKRKGTRIDLQNVDTFFFDTPISMSGRAMFYLIYKITRGAKSGWFYIKLWREMFEAKRLKPPMKLLNELEGKGILVGRLNRNVYSFERLIDVPFSYKDYPLPKEIGLLHPDEYGLYISYFLTANMDRVVLYPIKFRDTCRYTRLVKSILRQKGYISNYIRQGIYKIEVIPEEYKDLFLL
jgi:hypothetical protein